MSDPRIYAYVPLDHIVEVILPVVEDGVPLDISIEDRYTEDFAAKCIDITDTDPRPEVNWLASRSGGQWVFSPPPVYVRTPADILNENTAMRNQLLDGAAAAMAPLQDAVDLDEATASETALLKQWKQFRVAVNRVDLTKDGVAWPSPPAPLSYLTVAVVDAS